MPPASLIRKILKWSPLNLKDKNALESTIGWEEKKETKVIDLENDDQKVLKQKLIIWWQLGLDYKLCYCSRRKITNDIVAHINNKWLFTIHRRNCKVKTDYYQHILIEKKRNH